MSFNVYTLTCTHRYTSCYSKFSQVFSGLGTGADDLGILWPRIQQIDSFEAFGVQQFQENPAAPGAMFLNCKRSQRYATVTNVAMWPGLNLHRFLAWATSMQTPVAHCTSNPTVSDQRLQRPSGCRRSWCSILRPQPTFQHDPWHPDPLRNPSAGSRPAIISIDLDLLLSCFKGCDVMEVYGEIERTSCCNLFVCPVIIYFIIHVHSSALNLVRRSTPQKPQSQNSTNDFVSTMTTTPRGFRAWLQCGWPFGQPHQVHPLPPFRKSLPGWGHWMSWGHERRKGLSQCAHEYPVQSFQN